MAGWSRAAKATYLSLTTSGAGQSSPILFGSNQLGDALLSTGVMTLAGPTAASVVPVLPVRMSGIDVRETLHRLDADATAPTPERGITSANRIGEPLGVLTMRWLFAPDAFEAMPSTPPPNTELDGSRSQRFVMHDGVLRFQDRTQSGVRFFGAGRTYPTSADGGTRLLFAGAAVVIEGLGSLKGLRGSLTVVGEISARSLASLIVGGRFDDDGPFEVAEQISELFGGAADGLDATVLTLVSESGGGAAHGVIDERLRAARIENDLANAGRPRSAFHTGETVGRATGPLRFDPSDRRCAIPLVDARRELTFIDLAGHPVGTIVADALEGTAFRDQHAGDHVSRVIAYGPLSAGDGALAGAAGIMTMDTDVSPDGVASGVYTLWLADARGRFRAPVSRGSMSASGVSASATAAPPLRFVDASAGSMLPVDVAILAHAERTLAEGRELHQWFAQRDRSADYRERFDIALEYTSNDGSFGFFDVAEVGGSRLPVMGIVQDMSFDHQGAGNPERTRGQLQEFVLRYFMRICHPREPEAVAAAPGSALQRAMASRPGDVQRQSGTGYQQLYHRLADTGAIGKFTKDERTAIVDLRQIGSKYDWILLKVDTPSFDLPFAPFGSGAPKLQVPVKEATYLVMGPAFVTNVDRPEPGALAEYGFGYAFMPYAPDGPGLLAYGPGHFRAAIQTVRFKLMADGEIRARAVFVVSRPEHIAAMDVDPIGWGMQLADLFTFRIASQLMAPVLAVTDRLPLRAQNVDPIAAYIWMANMMTGGLAGSRFGLSKAVLEKRLLFQHFRSHHEMLHRSLQLWRMVPDWTDHEHLPDYCAGGLIS